MSILQALGIKIDKTRGNLRGVIPRSKVVQPIIPEKIRIIGVGEAPGAQETLAGHPFAGASGYLLARTGTKSGLFAPMERGESLRNFWVRNQVCLTNVIWEHPDKNNFNLLTCTRKEFAEEFGCKQVEVPQHTVKIGGRYVKPEHVHYIDKLRALLEEIRPNLVLAIGGKSLSVLCDQTSIKKSNGYITESTLVPGIKVLPILHPAGVLRDPSQQPYLELSLFRAAAEAGYPEIIYDEVTVIIQPTFEEVIDFFNDLYKANWPITTADIETAPGLGLITDISISQSGTFGISIPFINPENGSPYWTFEEEVLIWKLIITWLFNSLKVVWHNGTGYDLIWMRYICQLFQIEKYSPWAKSQLEDTLQLHHTLHPELGLALSSLGAHLLRRPQWKHLRARAKEKLKMDE